MVQGLSGLLLYCFHPASQCMRYPPPLSNQVPNEVASWSVRVSASACLHRSFVFSLVVPKWFLEFMLPICCDCHSVCPFRPMTSDPWSLQLRLQRLKSLEPPLFPVLVLVLDFSESTLPPPRVSMHFVAVANSCLSVGLWKQLNLLASTIS